MTDTKFVPGEYRTRDGRRAWVYATNGVNGYPLIGAIEVIDGGLLSEVWEAGGHIRATSGPKNNDLMPPKLVRYFNIYRDGVMISGFGFSSRTVADQHAGAERIACIRIEFEEGQYDD